MDDIETIEHLIWQMEEDHYQLCLENQRRKFEGVDEGPLPEIINRYKLIIPSFKLEK